MAAGIAGGSDVSSSISVSLLRDMQKLALQTNEQLLQATANEMRQIQGVGGNVNTAA